MAVGATLFATGAAFVEISSSRITVWDRISPRLALLGDLRYLGADAVILRKYLIGLALTPASN